MSELVVVAVIGVVGNIIVAVIGLINWRKIKKVQTTVDGGLSAQLSNAKDSGNKEGRTELRAENKADEKERKENGNH